MKGLNEIRELKTDKSVLRRLERGKAPSPAEVKEQRVSFVYGSLDSKSTMTREQVRKLVENAA